MVIAPEGYLQAWSYTAPNAAPPSNLLPQYSGEGYNTAHLDITTTKTKIEVRGFLGYEIDSRWIQYDQGTNNVFGIEESQLLNWVKVFNGAASFYNNLPCTKHYDVLPGQTLRLFMGYGITVPSNPTVTNLPITPTPTPTPIYKQYNIILKTHQPPTLIPNFINIVWAALQTPLLKAGYQLQEVSITGEKEFTIKVQEQGSLTLAALVSLIVGILVFVAIIVTGFAIVEVSRNETIQQETSTKAELTKYLQDAGYTPDQIASILGEFPTTGDTTGGLGDFKSLAMLAIIAMLVINMGKK